MNQVINNINEDYDNMSNEELINIIEDLEEALCFLENKISKSKKIKVGRKEQIHQLLLENKRLAVPEIAKVLNITARNVSSYLTYLRKDGINIGTDSKGRKFIELDD